MFEPGVEPGERPRLNKSGNQSGTAAEIEKGKRTASITPTLALSEGPLLSPTPTTTLSSKNDINTMEITHSMGKSTLSLKSSTSNLEEIKRKLHAEAILRKQMEDQCKKLQKEKLVSRFRRLPLIFLKC